MQYKIERMSPDELRHWGIKGQKWGIRRYENEDGTLTPEGKKRYAKIAKWYNGRGGERARAKTKSISGLVKKYEENERFKTFIRDSMIWGNLAATGGAYATEAQQVATRKFTERVIKELEETRNQNS